jgi:hypothetical protein
LAILVLTSLSCESTEDTLPTPHTVEYMVKLSEPYASSIATWTATTYFFHPRFLCLV